VRYRREWRCQFQTSNAKDAPNGMFELDIDDVSFVKASADGGL
jgi:hypothetical protein